MMEILEYFQISQPVDFIVPLSVSVMAASAAVSSAGVALLAWRHKFGHVRKNIKTVIGIYLIFLIQVFSFSALQLQADREKIVLDNVLREVGTNLTSPTFIIGFTVLFLILSAVFFKGMRGNSLI